MNLNAQQLEQAGKQLEQAIATTDIPGLVAVAGTAHGHHTVAVSGVRRLGGEAVTPDTYYDLASLTKVVSTLPAIIRLVSDGELAFDDTVGKFFSNAGWFQTPSLAEVTVRQLLSHTSGLPAWKPLFSFISKRQTVLANVLQSSLTGTAGQMVYSDLGFMLLGILVERITGLRQDAFVSKYIFDPLGLKTLTYHPSKDLPFAATEDCGWRNEVLEDVVHDENAFVMDGVAGHAGLFGTAADLASYAQAWLTLDVRLGSEAILGEVLQEYVVSGAVRRGLGWQLAGEGSSAGRLASRQAYGHTGFTGTSLWLDPVAGWFGVLLTNRVHPSRQGGQDIHKVRVRFYEAVAKAVTVEE